MAVQGFAPLIAGTGKVVQLAMQRLWLTGQVLPAGARLTLEHVFQSAEAQAVEVIYAFVLPRDAALRSFRVSGEGFSVHSELKETAKALEAYEEGMAKGALSTLARQYGDGVVNLTIGNLRPGETVTVHLEIMAGVESRDDGFRFRFPFTLAPTYHARARAREVLPGVGEIELPADEFGDVILPPFHANARNLHQVGFDLGVAMDDLSESASPSHAVRVRRQDGGVRVSLATAADVPDRDLVLDARCDAPRPLVFAGQGMDGRRRFAALIPSTSFGVSPNSPRRVVVLLDRSGSMGGEPIQQARRAITACLGALDPADQFGLVAFDDRIENFQPGLADGTKETRHRAKKFLDGIDARGGTELAAGFLEAARMLSGGGDVLILTDGQVAGTEEILAQARLSGIRIHCLGIGSASQDRFLSLLARETGGVSRFLTAQERIDLPAVDLFASIGRPVASGIHVEGADA
ncbi:MAG: VIT and VWA domain-containing protein, partial [Bryobacteraceae bacterium]